MTSRDLAVRLNVSQKQISDYLGNDSNPGGQMVTISRYVLESWQSEMRNAEIYLRDWMKNDPPSRL